MAVFADEEPLRVPRSDPGIGGDLSALSIDELEARIAALRAEIARIEEAVAAKSAQKLAADRIFGGG